MLDHLSQTTVKTLQVHLNAIFNDKRRVGNRGSQSERKISLQCVPNFLLQHHYHQPRSHWNVPQTDYREIYWACSQKGWTNLKFYWLINKQTLSLALSQKRHLCNSTTASKNRKIVIILFFLTKTFIFLGVMNTEASRSCQLSFRLLVLFVFYSEKKK